MGQQIIQQPNGLFAVWSSVVDGFVMTDATPPEIVDEWIKNERERLTQAVNRIVGQLMRGEKAYHQFTMTWDEALKEHEKRHGKLENHSR